MLCGSYKRMKDSHQALLSFNAFSAKEFARLGPELERKTKLIQVLKKDLYNIFDRISMLRETIGFHYPDHEVILPEELEEEEDDFPHIVPTPTGDGETTTKSTGENQDLLVFPLEAKPEALSSSANDATTKPGGGAIDLSNDHSEDEAHKALPDGSDGEQLDELESQPDNHESVVDDEPLDDLEDPLDTTDEPLDDETVEMEVDGSNEEPNRTFTSLEDTEEVEDSLDTPEVLLTEEENLPDDE